MIDNMPPPATPATASPGSTRVLAGSRRVLPPQQTLENISKLFDRVGITRVADVTGLDTIGIPVALAVRPNARSLSVSQGKGLSLTAAKVSAAMESLELHHAEHIDSHPVIASASELRRRGARVADPEALAKRVGSRYHDHLRIPWLSGYGLCSGAETLVPMEMVDMDCVRPRPYTTHVFYGGSNGLASGNNLAEATAHSLCELVERDAAALWWHRGARAQADTRIDPASITDPDSRGLLDRFDRAGVDVAIWDLTSDLGIPTIRSLVVDRSPFEGRRLMVTGGQGCHLDAAVALRRSLTEAAQARLTAITASRDDISRQSIEQAADARVAATARRELFADAAAPTRAFTDIPSRWNETLDEDITLLLHAITEAGLAEPVIVDLSRPGTGIAVVKAVGPGLEPNPAEAVLAGRRLRRALQEVAS